jgi:ribosomal RNA-processing protein 1
LSNLESVHIELSATPTMPAATTADSTNNPFIKSLASSNRTTRDRALDSLRTYLHRSTPFTEIELLKLWKGLFYCMWMSDKPLNQQRLARDLAALVDVLQGQENVLGWLRAFWQTMAREWAGIDALRMDKFLYLVRCYVGKGFEFVRGAGNRRWQDEDLLQSYSTILEEVPLNVDNGKIPNGLRYHVIDIFVDELDKVDRERDAPLSTLLLPLRKLGEKSVTRPVQKRVKEALEDERLEDWTNTGAAESSNEGVEDKVTEDSAPAADRRVRRETSDEDDFGGFDD